VDEARAVLERLERIEALERRRAPAAQVLAEVRALLAEAETWLRAEAAETSRAETAVDRCRDALAAAPAEPTRV